MGWWNLKEAQPGLESRPWQCQKGAARCRGMSVAVNGDVGTMVETVQEMILGYYADVGNQASDSFRSAKLMSALGFLLLASTMIYIGIVDVISRFNLMPVNTNYSGMDVKTVGLWSGTVVEAIAATQFWLYSKATKQFGAFHICLERTHRYLLAYKIAEKIKETSRDQALEKVVCIMANAPMISQADIDGLSSGKGVPDARTSVDDALRKAGAAGSGAAA